MSELLKNYKILLLLVFLAASFVIIGARGIDYGIDFKGGTLFQIELEDEITDLETRARVTSTISQRLDWTGLRDTTVHFFGDDFVIAQLAETDPVKVERIESLLMKQGRFEVTIEGETIFTGEGIIEIVNDPGRGYRIIPQEGISRWFLPFTLTTEAAINFKEMTWHKCELVGFDPIEGRQYDCAQTYFFIDRPKDSVLVIERLVFEADKLLLAQGNNEENIPQGTEVDEILLNSAMPYFVVDSNFSAQQITELKDLVSSNPNAIVSLEMADEFKQQLVGLGFEIAEVSPVPLIPFVWSATGVKQVISLKEDVTHMDVPDEQKDVTEPLLNLQIQGFAASDEEAFRSRADLEILLESGSLPVGVRSISKETISPVLGESFLFNAAIIGIVALLVVALVIFLRYRVLKLTVPIVFIGLSEVFITIAIVSLISKFDLGAVAGIIAAVGTGVDDQIIITDELVKGVGGDAGSLVARVKRAFFMVVAAAATTLATMAPIILIGFGLGKLIGFAITTSVGVLVGVLITRPAFSEIVKEILSNY